MNDRSDSSEHKLGKVSLENLDEAVEEAGAAVLKKEQIMRHFSDLIADVRRNTISFMTKPSVPQVLRPEMLTDRTMLIACAHDLYARHKKLNRAQAFAQAIEAWKRGDISEFMKWRNIAQRLGGFLYDNSVEEFMSRLDDIQHWSIARSAPAEGAGEQRFVADIQIHLPDDSDAALTSSPALALLPNGPRDIKYATNMGERLLARFDARRVAVVSDICAEDTYAHFGFASAARDAGIQHVQEMNEGRKHPVDTVLAAIFSIRGLKRQDGEIHPPLSLSNLISLKIHTMSNKHPADLVWCLADRNVPVRLEGDDPTKPPSELITNWEVCATKLS